MKQFILILLFLLLNLPLESFARGDHPHSSGRKSYSSTIKHYRSNRAQGVARDSHGRIKRSSAAKREFMKQTGYPHGRSGYVIDHKVALKCGGKDDPSNMQWQTKAEAKVKDKWE